MMMVIGHEDIQKKCYSMKKKPDTHIIYIHILYIIYNMVHITHDTSYTYTYIYIYIYYVNISIPPL